MNTKSLAAIAAVVLLAGCTSGAPNTYDPDPDPVVITKTASPEPVIEETEDLSVEDLEAIYLLTVRKQLRENYPDIDSISDADLLEVGKAPCGLLDDGLSVEDIYAAMIAEDVDADFGGVIVGAGVAAFCPEYQDEL